MSDVVRRGLEAVVAWMQQGVGAALRLSEVCWARKRCGLDGVGVWGGVSHKIFGILRVNHCGRILAMGKG